MTKNLQLLFFVIFLSSFGNQSDVSLLKRFPKCSLSFAEFKGSISPLNVK